MNLVEKIFILKNETVFSSLSNAELILVANIAKTRSYSKGSAIVEQNMPIQNIFILKDKNATYKEKVLAKCFGAEEMLNDVTLEEDIVAQEDIEVILISKGHFYTLVYECPSFMIDLLKEYDNNRIQR